MYVGSATTEPHAVLERSIARSTSSVVPSDFLYIYNAISPVLA